MPAELLGRLLSTFLVLFLLGSLLTLPLYKFDVRALMRSSLFVKIVMWLPIFVLFVGILYWPAQLGVAIISVVLVATGLEARALYRSRMFIPLYWLAFAVAFLHFGLIGLFHHTLLQNLLITIGLGSVLSDVTAFFFGRYLGRHKLPPILNDAKSWEGVAGQILGALIGVLIVNRLVTPVVSLWIFLPIGLGAALGDLANSFVKRRAGIKDWSRAIPGHGGFLDRCSSLAGSALLTFYFLILV
jgi:phosphatidate cytidylyltransferase